jgi:hypothetical protein
MAAMSFVLGRDFAGAPGVVDIAVKQGLLIDLSYEEEV